MKEYRSLEERTSGKGEQIGCVALFIVSCLITSLILTGFSMYRLVTNLL